MSFLAFNNLDIEFTKLKKLAQRFYTAAKALPTTSRIELINRRVFTKVVLEVNLETFIVYISALEVLTIHLSRAIQIAAL